MGIWRRGCVCVCVFNPFSTHNFNMYFFQAPLGDKQLGYAIGGEDSWGKDDALLYLPITSPAQISISQGCFSFLF